MTSVLRIRLLAADITKLAVDAIVCASNPRLAPGSGVSGAIHRAAGPDLTAHCRKAALVHPLSAGDIVATPGFRLPARRVLHAVTPVWRAGACEEDQVLARCWSSALEAARNEGLQTVAFPLLGAGAHLFPPEDAARVGLEAVLHSDFKGEVIISCVREPDFDACEAVARSLSKTTNLELVVERP